MNDIKHWLPSGVLAVLVAVLGAIATVMWNKIEAGDNISQRHYEADAAVQATLQANQEALKEKAIDTNDRVKKIDEKLDKLLEQKQREPR